MSGVLTGKPPRTDAQWARDVQQQLNTLDTPLTQRVGDWVFSQGSDGSLQVTKPGAGAVILDTEGNLVSAALSAGAVSGKAVGTVLTWQDIWNLFTGHAASTSTPSSPAADWVTEIQTWLTDQWNKFLTPSSTDWTSLLTKFGLLQSSGTNLVLDPGFDNPHLWTGDAGSQTTAVAHSGIYSWQLEGQG